MLTSEFDFAFPESLIAKRPLPRGDARLMVVFRSGGGHETWPVDFPLKPEAVPGGGLAAFAHTRDLPSLLRSGDALVLNETKVLPARLLGNFPTGGKFEFLLLRRLPGESEEWECLAKPLRKMRPGRRLELPGGAVAEILPERDPPMAPGRTTPEGQAAGSCRVRFATSQSAFADWLEAQGRIPLPPYMGREADAEDRNTYQTVFAREPGSVAAPTASLHFTATALEDLAQRGVALPRVLLHVSAGTFRPVETESIEDHPMHAETYSLGHEAVAAIAAAKTAGGRIIAAGTTAARVLETCAASGELRPGGGETRLFIRPGYLWKSVDGLLTNFHWPKSTLFMLVSSLLGPERARALYAEAIRREFRLFSYGDAMLIL